VRGENAILQAPRANRAVSASQITACSALVEGADVAMLQLETSMAAQMAFAARARECGIRTVLNPAPAASVPDELLQHTDVLVPNEIEACTLSGMRGEGVDAMFAIAEALLARGPRTVVITLGEAGAIACTNGVRAHVPAFSVPVVDTVGAGDAFCSGLAVRLGEGASLQEAVRFACAAGAVASGRPGAEPSMPHRAEVEELLRKGVQA
jgi:ribokinase